MERSPSAVAGSASKYCMLPSEQLIGVLAASPRGSHVMRSIVSPVAFAIASPRVRIDVLPGSPGPPQLTNIAPVRAPVAGIFVIASVIFSPSGAFQSLGTSIVVHWKPSRHSAQFSAACAGGGGAADGAGAPVQAVSATAIAAAPPIGRKPRIVSPLPRCPLHDLRATDGGQWSWPRHEGGPGPLAEARFGCIRP